MQPLHVRVGLCRELPVKFLAVLFKLLLVLDKPVASILELRLQELVRSLCKRLAITQALVDEEGGEPLRHVHRGEWIAGDEAHAKRIALHDLDADLLPHPLDDVLHDVGLTAIGVQIEILNDALQTRAAQNLLANRLHSFFDARGNRRAHVILGNPLRDHEDQRFRPIEVRQVMREHGCG